MLKNIKERENALFSLWRAKYDKRGLGFVADGVFDEDEYLTAPVKILFVLKEVNDKSASNWDLRDVVGQGKYGSTWSNITRWARAIFLSQKPTIEWNDIKDARKCIRKETLQKIVCVNLKKSPGGASSNMSEVGENSEPELSKQIALYNPDVVICCGARVAEILAMRLDIKPDWNVTDRNSWYYDASAFEGFSGFTPVIAFHHPQNRISASLMVFALIDAWNYIKNKHNLHVRP